MSNEFNVLGGIGWMVAAPLRVRKSFAGLRPRLPYILSFVGWVVNLVAATFRLRKTKI